MRRVPKPFAVEVRRSGRKGKATTTSQDDHSQVAARPRVDEEPAGSSLTPEAPTSAAVASTGRILPALDQPVTPKPAKKPRGRKPQAVSLPLNAVKDELELTDDVELDEIMPQTADRISPATLPVRKGRTKLPRDAFERSERWKARLPIVVHRPRKRWGA